MLTLLISDAKEVNDIDIYADDMAVEQIVLVVPQYPSLQVMPRLFYVSKIPR